MKVVVRLNSIGDCINRKNLTCQKMDWPEKKNGVFVNSCHPGLHCRGYSKITSLSRENQWRTTYHFPLLKAEATARVLFGFTLALSLGSKTERKRLLLSEYCDTQSDYGERLTTVPDRPLAP
jgi:hypothetical protein